MSDKKSTSGEIIISPQKGILVPPIWAKILGKDGGGKNCSKYCPLFVENGSCIGAFCCTETFGNNVILKV